MGYRLTGWRFALTVNDLRYGITIMGKRVILRECRYPLVARRKRK